MPSCPFVDLRSQHQAIRSELLDAAARVLDGGQYILGEEVELLEREVASLCRVREGVGVASGTDALALLLRAHDVGPGDEVVTSPFTFFATAQAVLEVGAVPVFADIDPTTCLMTASSAKECITARTRAILAVHLFGQMTDMTAMRALADAHGLWLLEDACQALGAQWEGRAVGELGDGAAVSFFPTKNLGGYGDGGMVLLQDPDRAARVRRLRVHGSVRKYVHAEVGWNSRLDELQAALLRVKLRRLEEWTRARLEIAERYDRALAGLPLTLPRCPPQARHVYHLYTVSCPRRDSLREALASDGIGSGVYYPVPLHLQPALSGLGYREGDLPFAERLCQEVLSLPLYPGLSVAAQDLVVDRIRAFFAG